MYNSALSFKNKALYKYRILLLICLNNAVWYHDIKSFQYVRKKSKRLNKVWWRCQEKKHLQKPRSLENKFIQRLNLFDKFLIVVFIKQ